MLAHLRGTGRAVHPDQVDAQRLQCGQRRTDLRADQHRSGGLHGDLRDDRQLPAGLGHRPLRGDDRGLGLQEVLRGLHQHHVDAAVEHAQHLLDVGVAQHGVGRVPQRRQLRAGPDRTQHEPRPLRRRVLVGGLAGQRRARLGQFPDPFRDVVLAEVGQVRAEGVGLDRVRAGLQIPPVDRGHHVGPRHVQDLVAAL